jgi:hypothetical protein
MGEPVAELRREKMGDQELYHFKYLPKFQEADLAPLPGFPDLGKDYWQEELWAFFAERIPDVRRPEIAAVLKQKRISEYEKLKLLAELGSLSVTDPFVLRMVA